MKKAALFAAAVVVLIAAAGPRREPKVGVVDLRQCFDDTRYEGIAAKKAELQTFMDGLKLEAQQLNDRMVLMAKEVEGSEGELKRAKSRELRGLETQAKLLDDEHRAQATARFERLQIEIYEAVRAAVDGVGRDGAFDVILRIEDPRLKLHPADSAERQIKDRTVLFAGEGTDVTDKVIERMNRAFRERK